MVSLIDERLTDEERRVLAAYRAGDASDLRRVTRLSIQYALGAGVFAFMALVNDEPRWVLPVYATLILVLGLRLVRARAIAGAMPTVIEKYEQEISALRRRLGRELPTTSAGAHPDLP